MEVNSYERIDFAFYDEPTLRWVEGGRTWTARFNRAFEDKYGFSPVILYPALWYDIGPETWDPQTGEIKRCNTSTLTQNGTDISRFQLTLDPVKS
jgi:hypothetical protein